MRFDGMSAIVTGAARGIGLAIATRLAHEGAGVMIADIDLDEAQRAAAVIGDTAVPQQLDVTEPASWDAAVREAQQRWSRIDALVNNAGIAGRAAPIWELAIDEWQHLIDIDLTGVFLGCRAVIPVMVDQRRRTDRQYRLHRRQGGQSEHCSILRCQGRRYRSRPRRSPKRSPLKASSSMPSRRR